MGNARSPRQYTGVRAIHPPDLTIAEMAPTGTDKAYLRGQLWLDKTNLAAYMYSGTSWITLGSGTTGGINSITGDTGGAIVAVAGNIDLLGTAVQGLSFAGSAGTITGTIADWTTAQKGVGVLSTNAQAVTGTGTTQAVTPAALTARLQAPGAIGGTTPGAGTFTTLTAVGTVSLNASGAATTTIGTGGTGATLIGNATGNTAITGSLTTTTTLTATLGDITATNGNLVSSASGKGLLFNSPAASGVAASPVVVNGRSGQATFTSVSIAANADLTLTITNSAITGSSTQVIYSMSGATTGAALSIKSVTNSAGSSAIVVTNGVGATTSVANIVMNFLVIN